MKNKIKKPNAPAKGTEISKIERVGDSKVVIHHENGDTFEGDVDTNKINFAEDSRKTASRFHFIDMSPCITCDSKWHRDCSEST